MRDAYRSELDAALQQIEALRRENERLREQLGERASPVPSVPTRSRVAGALTVLALAGFVTGSIATVGSLLAPRRAPCPYSGARTLVTPFEPIVSSRSAELRVNVSPPGARAAVEVDGETVSPAAGTSTFGTAVDPNRAHRVVVRAAGYDTADEIVRPFADSPQFIQVVLQARGEAATDPFGACVSPSSAGRCPHGYAIAPAARRCCPGE